MKNNLELFLESYANGKELAEFKDNGPKPSGYWKDFENVKKELLSIIDRFGEFPSQKKLNSNGFSSLAAAILKYHGGFLLVRERLGYKIIKHDNNYLKNFENVKARLNEIIEEIGHFPSCSELTQRGKSSIAMAIRKYHGGINSVREKLGYEKIEFEIEKYKNFSLVKKTLEKLIQDIGHFPSAEEIRKKGFGILISACYKYYNGLEKVREKMGYESANINDRKYAGKKGLFVGLRELCKKFPEWKGKIPSDNWMRENGFSHIGNSIIKYHGGFRKLRKKLGIKQLRLADEFNLKNWNVLISELNKIYDKHPEFNRKLPSSKWLEDSGYIAITNAIRKYHKGFIKTREKLGEELIRVRNGYYQDFRNIKKELEQVIENHKIELNGKFPSCQWLNKNGYSYLISHIFSYHGGINEVRKRLGIKIDRVNGDYWQDWNNVKNELQNIFSQFGKIPGSWILRNNGKIRLVYAIMKYYGGMTKAREKFYQEIGYNQDKEIGQSSEKQLEHLLQNYVGGEQ